MILNKTKNGEYNILISKKVDSFGLQRLINYIKYLELTNNSKAKQKDAELLADELSDNWWKNNRKRLLNE